MVSLAIPQKPNSSSELGQKKRILLVEDEELIRDMLVVVLEEEGYQVLSLSNGRAALTVLGDKESSQDGFVPDLILPD